MMANPWAGLWLLAGLGTGAVAATAVAMDVGGVRTAMQERFGGAQVEEAAVPASTPSSDATAETEIDTASATPEAGQPAEAAQDDQAAAPADDLPETDTTELARVGDAVEPPTLTDGIEPTPTDPEIVAPQDTSPDAAEIEPVVPQFGLLRVEPDGSLVIAGFGPNDATIEVLAGSRAIAQVQSAVNGDFAAVLDEPLAPGDYQIVLRATAPDGVAVTSRETAVISIPEAGSTDVLALVEEPGKPSRLITTPGPDSPVLATVPTPGVEAGGETPAAVADAEPGAEQAAELAEQPATGSDDQVAAEAEPTPEAQTDETVEVAALPGQEAEAPIVTDAPSLPLPGGSPDLLRIEAVEIDGQDLFVAGAASAGTRLLLYANEILLGDTVASEGGRFLVQVRRDLPVGDYIIRADAIDPATGQVLKRAQVPFARSAGERLAAIAVVPSAELPPGPPTIPFDEIVTPEPDAVAEAQPAAQEPQTPSALAQPDGADAPAEPQTQDVAAATVPQALGVLQGPPPVPTDVPVTTGELVPTGESVIIRRGDTLWQISRRIYGEGIKYTTIYLANEGQIADPDRIWPGQIFAVPEDAMDDAETVHRQLRERN